MKPTKKERREVIAILKEQRLVADDEFHIAVRKPNKHTITVSVPGAFHIFTVTDEKDHPRKPAPHQTQRKARNAQASNHSQDLQEQRVRPRSRDRRTMQDRVQPRQTPVVRSKGVDRDTREREAAEETSQQKAIVSLVNNKLVQLGYAKWYGDKLVVNPEHKDSVVLAIDNLKESIS